MARKNQNQTSTTTPESHEILEFKDFEPVKYNHIAEFNCEEYTGYNNVNEENFAGWC